jgi:pimeloyl-ACP methyl ester carboxylesterase
MFAAIRRGAKPTAVEWSNPEEVDELTGDDITTWVAAQTNPRLDRSSRESTLLIGKSLGSYVAVSARDLQLPAIWVTPLLRDFALRDALSRTTSPFMLVGGTADPHWDGNEARGLTPHVLEFPNADHGLFVSGPLALSAQNMSVLATATEQFLDQLDMFTARTR